MIPFLVSFLFASTEGHSEKLQMRGRFSALPFGQQAAVCIEGRRAADQTGSPDRRGSRRGERPHRCVLGERPGSGLKGAVVVLPASVCPPVILLYEYGMYSVQVHMTAEPYIYSETAGVSVGEKVNRNLFFDLSHSHIYITTEKKVTPVGKQPLYINK